MQVGGGGRQGEAEEAQVDSNKLLQMSQVILYPAVIQLEDPIKYFT